MANILAENDILLDVYNPTEIAKGIADRLRKRRLEMNLTQKTLAKRAGVSLGSLKRFESTSEISLKHLLLIAVVLDATEEFGNLFLRRQFESINQALESYSGKRKRGKLNG